VLRDKCESKHGEGCAVTSAALGSQLVGEEGDCIVVQDDS